MKKSPSNRKVNSKAALAVLAALGIATTANAQDGTDWVEASSIDGVTDVRQLSDGSVELVLEDGSVTRVDAVNIAMVDGQLMITAEAVAGLAEGGALAGLGGNAVLYGIGAVAGVGVVAAAAGGGDDNNNDGGNANVPTDGDDVLVGTPDPDTIDGLAGNDTISGLESDDTLIGGEGNDTLDGGAGADSLTGGAGDDTVIADQFDTTLDGGTDTAETRGAASADDIAQGDTLDLSGVDAGARIDLDVNNQGVLQAENENSNATAQGLSDEGSVSVGDATVTATDFENAIGTEFNDVVLGNAEDNVLIGGAGDDALHPFGGTDFVDGGEGTDVLLLNGFPKGSLVDLNTGTAQFIDGTGGVNTFVNIENVNGSSVAGDEIIGDDNANVLNGLGGNDTLIGGAGDDTLIGGNNADQPRADAQGDNTDILRGGDGNDTLTGNLGNDQMFGEAGDDLMVWNNGDGSDLMVGGEGDDRSQVNFQQNTDLSQTDLQNDDVADFSETAEGVQFARIELNGQTEAGLFQLDIRETETLETNFGGGNDTAVLQGDIVNAIALDLDGGADEADTRNAVSADDIAQGDTLDLSGMSSAARVDLDQNNQGVLQEPTDGGLTQEGFVEVDGVRAVTNDFENVIGTDFNDVIFGNAQNNVLIGGDGDDALHPFGGQDFVDGGAGTDVLLLNGFANGQFVDVAAGIAGDANETGDGIADGATLNTFINIENINGSSVAGDVIIGDDIANVINGLGGDDTINGGDGNDTLLGNLGDDTVFGEEGDDLLIWNNGDGSDLLNGGAGDDRVQVNFQQNTDRSQLDLQNDDVATIADDGAGGITFNRAELNGQSVNGLFQLDIEETETLEVNFGGGTDAAQIIDDAVSTIAVDLDGGDGVDTLDFSGVATVDVDLATGAFGDDDSATNFENVIGTAGDDTIVGSDAANIIEAGSGNDTLTGGAGADTFVVSDGDDADVITDFAAAEDVIDVTGHGLTEVDALALASDDGGGNTIIDFGDGDTVTLNGVAAADLSEANFASGGSSTVLTAGPIELVDLSEEAETVIDGADSDVEGAIAEAPVSQDAFGFEAIDPAFEGSDAGLVAPPVLTGSDLGDSL